MQRFITSVYNGKVALVCTTLYRTVRSFFKHCLTQHLVPSELFYFFSRLLIPPILKLGKKCGTYKNFSQEAN